MHLSILVVACALTPVFAACAPVIRPPSPPQGFSDPPHTAYAGMLSRDGVAAIAPDAPTPPGAAASATDTLSIDYLDGNRALIRVSPTCTLPAAVLSPPYLETPGIGFTRQREGTLALQAGARCALATGAPFIVLAGDAAVRGVGLLDLTAAGRDARGQPGSIHFTGTLAAEREPAPAAPATTVKVHLLAELVSSCSTCRLNHRPLSEPGAFAFEPKLEQEVPTPAGATWRPICAAPCAAAVDRSALLRVAGAGLLDSAPFYLPPGRPRVVLKASSTGPAARAFGRIFVGAGAAYVGLGATLLALGAAEPTQTPPDRTRAHGLEIGGGAFILTSLAFFIPGLLVLHHQGTVVTNDAGETLVAP